MVILFAVVGTSLISNFESCRFIKKCQGNFRSKFHYCVKNWFPGRRTR